MIYILLDVDDNIIECNNDKTQNFFLDKPSKNNKSNIILYSNQELLYLKEHTKIIPIQKILKIYKYLDYKCSFKNQFDYKLLESSPNTFYSKTCTVKNSVRITKYYLCENKTINKVKTLNYDEMSYIYLLNKILHYGQYSDDRTGVGTLFSFGEHLEFDISNSIPLFTTKKVFFRCIVEELLFFLSGKTNVKILQDKNVHIWDGNSSREYLDSIGLLHFKDGDLGKFYGFQWRHWGAEYIDCDHDYTSQGIDQIEQVIDLIKHDPYSRRIIITAWNPTDLHNVVLPPCHTLCQFNVNIKKGTLSCNMYQRSADLFLGVPFNVASYAILTYLIALECNLKPEKLRVNFGNTHIYLNHLEQVQEQITRKPFRFPKIEINKKNSLNDYCYDDFVLKEYKFHSKLKGKMAI